MRKFFIQIKNDKVIFSLSDIKHLKVLRIKKDKKLKCYDQNGNSVLINIDSLDPFEASLVEMQETKMKIQPYNITCFMGVIKKNNFELVVEKMNELNILEIYPTYFGYSQNNIKLNYERLNKIAQESCKQSNRIKPIVIHSELNFNQLIDKLKEFDYVFFCYENENKNILSNLNNIENNKKIAFIIGPEGGFKKDEVKIIEKYAIKIKLTNTILKSETAAIYIASNLIERFCNEK